MKKFGAMALACALSVVGATAASAANHGWYVSGELGAADGSGPGGGSSGTSGAAFAEIGWRFGNNFAAELEFGDRSSGGMWDSVDQKTIMVNLIANIPLSGSFSAALGAGIGLDSYEASDWYGSRSDIAGAAQVLAELNYQFGETWGVFARYRYEVSTSIDLPYDDGQVKVSSATLGVRVNF